MLVLLRASPHALILLFFLFFFVRHYEYYYYDIITLPRSTIVPAIEY